MNDKHTAKCRKLLQPENQDQFTVLAQVMEKASIIYAICLSPMIWALKNRHYVMGYDGRTRKLHLYRVPMGFFGLGRATEVEAFRPEELGELNYRERILTATLTFRKPDGTKVKLFVPKPSKKNAKAVYEALCGKV